jgi:hypothetical protein
VSGSDAWPPATQAQPGEPTQAQAGQAGQADGPEQAGEPGHRGEPVAVRERHVGRVIAAVVVLVVVVAAVVLVVADPFRKAGAASGSTAAAGYRTGTASVTQGSLTSQNQVDGTLGDAGTYSVVNQAQGSGSSSSDASSSSAAGAASGTITELPQPGQTIRQGHELYGVSGSPVVLLYGDVPAYRDLAEGDTGSDVSELNTDLVQLGYVTAAELGPRSGWDYYSGVTADGVDALQVKLGETETGTLTLGQAVFLPTAALITGYPSTTVLGGSVTPGAVVLTASSTTPLVVVELDAGEQSEVSDGDKVGVTLPDGTTTPGVVSLISNVASASSSSSSSSSGSSGSGSSDSGSGSGSPATITVEVALTNPKAAGHLNQAPVVVTITAASVSNVLTVPVDALLAQAGGGYAVEVISGSRHHLVPVTPGLFDDAAGKVQVSGAGLAAGQTVVVPAT